MKVPLLDLKKQYKQIKDEVMLTVENVFESQYFILGPNVKELEDKVAEYCGSKYAVGVSSGSDALLISLMVEGIKAGDIVITTPYTFFATGGAIARVGAELMFVDINRDTYNIDPDLLAAKLQSLDVEQRRRVKAVIPVHLYGQCADMEPIMAIADEYGLTVVEDAAQAIGSEYQYNDDAVKRAGSMGHYGCFSFYPSKNLGAFGDGGMVVTDSSERYERLKMLRMHGGKDKYHNQFVGGNFRLDALQAAILIIKLKYLDEWSAKRIENADLYRKLFVETGLNDIVLPVKKEYRHIYNQFVIKVRDKRDKLKIFLSDHEIGYEIYYPVPLHMLDCFKYLNHDPGEFPLSVEAAQETLALPIYPELTEDQLKYVVDIIGEYHKNN